MNTKSVAVVGIQVALSGDNRPPLRRGEEVTKHFDYHQGLTLTHQMHALLNLIRCHPSYLPTPEVIRWMTSDLGLASAEVLRELARILGLRTTARKAELIEAIRLKVSEVIKEPLSLANLRREATVRGIQPFFDYQELRYLCGYTVVDDVGVTYFTLDDTSSLALLITRTEVNSGHRLFRLKNEPGSLVQWHVRNLGSTSSHRDIYQALAVKGVILTEEMRSRRIIYLSSRDPFAFLLRTAPRSLARSRHLQDYDAELLRIFNAHHQIEYDLNEVIAVEEEGEDDDEEYSYTDGSDPMTTVLYQTEPNTLDRYVRLLPHHFASSSTLSYLCQYPRLSNQIRDYQPQEIADLPFDLLVALARREGIIDHDDEHLHEQEKLVEELQLACFLPTFYQAPLPSSSVITSLHNRLSEVPPSQRYVYGIRPLPFIGNGVTTYFERDELQMSFRVRQCFAHPITRELFSYQAIRRLYILNLNDHSDEGREFGHELQSMLRSSIAFDQQQLVVLRQLEVHKPAVLAVLEVLFETALIMRRWKGHHGTYPFTVASTLAEEGEDEDAHFARIEASLERLFTSIESLAVKEQVWSLRIRNYLKTTYYLSTEADDGYTLRDRYNIVRQGNDPNAPMESCVRLTSGWLLFTALYYYQELSGSPLKGLHPSQFEFIS